MFSRKAVRLVANRSDVDLFTIEKPSGIQCKIGDGGQNDLMNVNVPQTLYYDGSINSFDLGYWTSTRADPEFKPLQGKNWRIDRNEIEYIGSSLSFYHVLLCMNIRGPFETYTHEYNIKLFEDGILKPIGSDTRSFSRYPIPMGDDEVGPGATFSYVFRAVPGKKYTLRTTPGYGVIAAGAGGKLFEFTDIKLTFIKL